MRSLTPSLDYIQLRDTARHPGWQVLIYDIRSGDDTINSVVRFNIGDTDSLEPLTGPRDFTADVLSVQVEEQRGDYINSGVVATQVTLVIADPSGVEFDPYLTSGIPTTDPAFPQILGRYLRRGNVVVLKVGDTRVDSEEWPSVFTGEITGQAGRIRGRSDGAVSNLTVRALSREAAFIKYTRTSRPFSGGESHQQASVDIAEEDMGLDLSEYDLSGWGAQLFGHQSVQFVEETPLSMLAKLMFQYSLLPRFNGDGVLTRYSTVTTSLPSRVYEDFHIFRQFNRPFAELEQPNSVTIVGLDAELSKISQPNQLLAELNLTTGYFTTDEEVKVYWSSDRTIVAENATARTIKSGGISWLGGTEESEEIPSPGPGALTSSIGMVVSISTGYAPWIIVVLLVVAVALALYPDGVITGGFAIGFGETIGYGRLVQQVALSAALYVMTQIGRVQMEFYGEPIEWVYKEIRSKAKVAGTSDFEQNEVVIENHLINSQSSADNIARDTLFLVQSQGNVREVEMFMDLALETGDVFEVSTTQRFMVDTISYTLVRNPETAVRASVGCFEVTSGVLA